MPKYIALLRAINVGGHTVTMDRLRAVFDSLGFSEVETFIASGNVVFESRSKDEKALARKIETALRGALGYDVATFIRTPEELARVAAYRPFKQAELDAATALNIGFVADPLDRASVRKVMAFRTAIDDFHVHGREVYWKCLGGQGDSKFTNAAFEKALGLRATFRGVNTVKKMAAKYC